MTRLNARIDRQLAEKLERIRAATDMSITDIVRSALEAYYERFESERYLEAHRIFEEVGFVGCGESDSSLSERYKKDLAESLGAKLGPADGAPHRPC